MAAADMRRERTGIMTEVSDCWPLTDQPGQQLSNHLVLLSDWSGAALECGGVTPPVVSMPILRSEIYYCETTQD